MHLFPVYDRAASGVGWDCGLVDGPRGVGYLRAPIGILVCGDGATRCVEFPSALHIGLERLNLSFEGFHIASKSRLSFKALRRW